MQCLPRILNCGILTAWNYLDPLGRFSIWKIVTWLAKVAEIECESKCLLQLVLVVPWAIGSYDCRSKVRNRLVTAYQDIMNIQA